jgi:hypothetical protein
MPGTLPHTQNGFAQTGAEQKFRGDLGGEGANANPTANASASATATATASASPSAADDDPTTLKFEGKVAISDDDAGNDPYNRTGKFRRLVR